MEPGFHALWPGSDLHRSAAKAVTVSTLGVDMQFGRDLGVLEGEKVDGGIFHVDRVVLGLNDK